MVRTVDAKDRRRRAHARIAAEAVSTAQIGAHALDVELGGDAP